MTVATLADAGALNALAPAWARLFEAAVAATPFQSPAWLMSWVEVFAPKELRVFAASDGEALVGLAPFFIHRDAETGAAQLTLVGNGMSDHVDVVAAPARREAVAHALAAWLAEAPWDRLDFRDVPPGSPLLTMPLPVAGERIEPEEPCPVVELLADPDQVVGRLDKKRRYDLRHGAQKLSQMGELTCAMATSEAERQAIFAALIELHQRRWAERGKDGVFSDPLENAFHEAATQALLEAGLLRLYALKLDGQTIAAHYAMMKGERAYSYIHAFDPDLAACNPGAVLTARVLEDAVRSGARTFDFLRGSEPYKYRWGAVDQPKHRRRAWR